MSKIFRTVVASSVIAGVAVLTPLSAQAKDEPPLGVNVGANGVGVANGIPTTLESCASATAATGTGTITGSTVAGLGFKVTIPAFNPADVYESRARVYTVRSDGSKSFTTKRTRVSNTLDTAIGSVGPGQFIWRFDVVNTSAEAAGLPALVYTSAGFVNCD